MTTIEKKLKISAAKNDVWSVLADLGGIQNYNPTVKKSFYNTDLKSGKGAGRVCEFYPMGKVDEKATQWNEGNSYTLLIKPIEKIPFFKEGTAYFELNEIQDNETEVYVRFTYGINKGLIAQIMNSFMLKNNFNKGFEGILKGLKMHIEEGVNIENTSTLKGYQVSFA
jgi:polyketide cyclase/dehydrase/lipid transport protein